MIKVFILNGECINVDNKTDARRLIKEGAKEVTDLSIFGDHVKDVCPANTKVNADGSITFTPPTDEAVKQKEIQKEILTKDKRIAEIKEELVTAYLLDDEDTLETLKTEYKELINEGV